MNPYLSLVNQRFCFSGLLLEQLIEHERQDSNRLLILSLVQSVLFQLEATYRFYLREVAATYKCRGPEQVTSVDELIDALESMGKSPAEASELAHLEHQKGSWLKGLLSAYRQMLEVQSEQLSEKSPITVVQVSADRDEQELNAELLAAWRNAFYELVERHRQHMLEC